MILVLPLLSMDWLAWLPANMILNPANMSVNNAPIMERPAVPVPVAPVVPNLQAPQEILNVEVDVVTPLLCSTAIVVGVSLFPILRRVKASRAAQRCKRGQALQNQGDFDAAIAAYNEALRANRKQVAAYIGRGTAFMQTGRFDRALADLDTAIRLVPDVAGLLSVRAAIHASRGDHDRALADYDRALRLIPESSQALVGRGLACYSNGEFDRAIADLNQALRLNPNDALALNNRGAAFLKKGEYASAVADLRQAMRLKPDFPNPYKHLAWIQATCPDPQFRDGLQAVANAFRALQLTQWKPVEWLATLAAAHAENGDFDEAVKWQSKCLDESPAAAHADLEDALILYQARQRLRDCTAAVLPDSLEVAQPSQCDASEADAECVACT